MGMTRKSVKKWINKALTMGADAALKNAYHRPYAPVITEEARAWVIHLAVSSQRNWATVVDPESVGAACAARGATGGTSFVETCGQSHIRPAIAIY